MSDQLPSPSIDANETNDVGDMMRPLYREHDEPRDGFEPVPFWLAVIFGGLFFWAGWYIANNTSRFQANVFDQPYPSANATNGEPTLEQVVEQGRQLYAQCAVCHQADGTGLDGVHPPLKGSEWVTGNEAKPERIIALTLYGGQGEFTVKGVKYTAPMPAYGGQWNDREIAAVLTYIRTTWGNSGSPVTPEEVTAIRTAEAGRSTTGAKAFTMAELLKK